MVEGGGRGERITISPGHSQFFNVTYINKIRVAWGRGKPKGEVRFNTANYTCTSINHTRLYFSVSTCK